MSEVQSELPHVFKRINRLHRDVETASRISQATILEKAKTLNPLLDLKEKDFLELLNGTITDEAKAIAFVKIMMKLVSNNTFYRDIPDKLKTHFKQDHLDSTRPPLAAPPAAPPPTAPAPTAPAPTAPAQMTIAELVAKRDQREALQKAKEQVKVVTAVQPKPELKVSSVRAPAKFLPLMPPSALKTLVSNIKLAQLGVLEDRDYEAKRKVVSRANKVYNRSDDMITVDDLNDLLHCQSLEEYENKDKRNAISQAIQELNSAITINSSYRE